MSPVAKAVESRWPAACHLVDPDEAALPTRVYTPALPIGPTDAAYGRNFELADDANIVVIYPRAAPSNLLSDGERRFERSCAVAGLECIALPSGAPLAAAVSRRLFLKLNETRGQNLFVMWVADAARTLLLGARLDILRNVQMLLNAPVETEADRPESPDIVAAGGRRCRDLCGGKFVWPQNETSDAFGTRYFEPRLLVGRIAAMVNLSLTLPLPSKVPMEGMDLEVGDAINIVSLYAPQNSTNATVAPSVKLEVDVHSDIFQSLHGYGNDLSDGEFGVAFRFKGVNDTRFWNKLTKRTPVVAYAGTNEDLLNQVGNYAPMMWSPHINATTLTRSTDRRCGVGPTPRVLVLVQVEVASPFLDYFLEALEEQQYPKLSMTLRFSVLEATPRLQRLEQRRTIVEWMNRVGGRYRHASVDVNNASAPVLAAAASAAAGRGYDRVLLLSSHVILNNTDAIGYLARGNRTAVTPIITRPGKWFSNVWAAVDGGMYAQCYDTQPQCPEYVEKKYCTEGEYVSWMKLNCRYSCALCKKPSFDPAALKYKRSADYFHLANRSRRGLFNVPLANSILMLNRNGLLAVHGGVADDISEARLNQTQVNKLWPWMVAVKVSQWVRKGGGAVTASTVINAGFLIDDEHYDFKTKHPELNLLDGNEPLWRRRYLASNYAESIPGNRTVRPECWDIYGFPLFNEAFARHLIANAEAYGQWSSSRYRDSRLKGGFEPVPTQDIHFNQFGFQKTWAAALRVFVAPLAEKIFSGYNFRGMETLDFIVRYKPDGQASLRPHFDASTFSTVVTLNRQGVDFEGGGTHFIRQNCTVAGGEVGSAIMFPGLLTHQHEGLETTKGTRYIIVSFVDQR